MSEQFSAWTLIPIGCHLLLAMIRSFVFCTRLTFLSTSGTLALFGVGAPLGAALPALAEPAPVVKTLAYGARPEQTLDVYQPTGSSGSRGTILFFFGGNWQAGDKKDYHFVGETLASKGIVTIIANYRLYPQTSFPGFIDDAALAVKWAHDHAANYGGSASSLFLMGNGSGAFMSLLLGLDPEYLTRVGLSSRDIRGVICLAGFYGSDMTRQPGVSSLVADVHDPDTLLPFRFARAPIPPMLLIVSRDEDASDSSDIELLDRAVLEHGGSVKMVHHSDLGRIGIMLPFSPLFHMHSSVIQEVLDFMTDAPDAR